MEGVECEASVLLWALTGACSSAVKRPTEAADSDGYFFFLINVQMRLRGWLVLPSGGL